jgi:hypothetical protein
MSILPVILVGLGFWAVLSGLLLVYIKKRRKIGMVLFLVYVFTYIPFSMAGRYVIANHGGSDWRREWCPPYLMYEYRIIRPKIGITRYGMVYLPCILFDRLIWHPSREAGI